MRGIILTAGAGTRLAPATEVLNKNLLPILNCPMIVFSIEMLRDTFGITDILIVSNPRDIGDFAKFLKDGSHYKVNLTYKVQSVQTGIASAIGIAENFVPKNEKFLVLLGDNIFLTNTAKKIKFGKDNDSVIFTQTVPDPERFGVLVSDKSGKPISIEEKPKAPKSNSIVTGLYVYPYSAFAAIKKLKPSARGEYEVTDLNNFFLKKKQCRVIENSTFCDFWADVGTPDSLFEAGSHIMSKRRAGKETK